MDQPKPNRSGVSLAVDLILIASGVLRLSMTPRTGWSIGVGIVLIVLGSFGLYTWFAVRRDGGRDAAAQAASAADAHDTRDHAVNAEIERLDARTQGSMPPPPPGDSSGPSR